ncbi:MAG: polysaccharide biosynthesis/export family protein [Cytophagaceae bacterium]|nr:polysaccharide biosynthesis/export family protein [Cytophagaceae bacterium]
MNGCIPQRETVYLRDLSEEKDYENPYSELKSITDRYQLRPNDQLYIQVTTSDPKLSEFFNPSRLGGALGSANQSLSLYTYVIDDNMDIDFPFVGKINLKECTRVMAEEKVTEVLQPFLKEAQVLVRLYNSSFIALGEFGNVGRIDMGKEQVTIFEAVALAGDIKSHGKKRQVQITRPTSNGSVTFFVDLTDRNIVDSDQYYIYSNDIIYVRPMKAKSWGFGESFSFGIFSSTIGMVSSTIALIFTIQALKK